MNIDYICRICLSKNGDLKSFKNYSEEAKGILTKLTSVLNFEIALDRFPCNLCCKCEDLLNIAYDFQQLGIKSHEILIRQLSKEVKQSETIQAANNLADRFEHNKTEILHENSAKTEELNFDHTSDNVADLPDDVNYRQNMRLRQYSEQEVEYFIKKVQERYLKETNCIYCDFNANSARALSVHMSKLHRNERNYWCAQCNAAYDNLPLHIYDSHKDDLKCPFCSKLLNKVSHFTEHLYSHTRKRKFLCETCNKSFISPRHLKMHQKVHIKARNCRICGENFKLKRSLFLHLKTHSVYDCKLCQHNFSSVEELESHRCFEDGEKAENPDISCPNEESLFQPNNYCKECDKKVRSLKNHKELHHSQRTIVKPEEKPSLCTYCGKQFRFASKLTIHLRTHTGEVPYKCQVCDRRFATRGHLVVHERIHTGEKPHVCSVCGKGFTQSSMLNTHMKIHTGKNVACLLCPKKFCRPSELKQHMRTHSGEKPFSCTQCGSSFKQRSHLVGHIRTHSNERPYQCEYCDKSFKKMSTLKIHLNVHSTARESDSSIPEVVQVVDEPLIAVDLHKCSICLENFASIALLSSHHAINHGELTEASTIGLGTTFVDIMERIVVVPSSELGFSNL